MNPRDIAGERKKKKKHKKNPQILPSLDHLPSFGTGLPPQANIYNPLNLFFPYILNLNILILHFSHTLNLLILILYFSQILNLNIPVLQRLHTYSFLSCRIVSSTSLSCSVKSSTALCIPFMSTASVHCWWLPMSQDCTQNGHYEHY